MTAAAASDLLERVEHETRTIGQYVWGHLHRRRPSMFERRWWDDRILGVAMADESVKVQMFRFVDVLPRLRSHQDVTRHLQEYFEEIREHLPWAVELVKFGIEHMRPDSVLSRALAYNARTNAARMARRFIAGESVDEVTTTVQALRRKGFAFTLDLLGEAVISEQEADAYQQQYLTLLTELAPVVNAWPESTQADSSLAGTLPRVNLSLKLSALVSRFRVADPAGTSRAVKERLRPLLREARANHAYLHVDMEQYSYKDLTLQIFREILMEPEFRDFADVGIVVQAYLHDAEQDLRELRTWAEKRGTPVWVRLVKGAYWDFETIVSGLNHWPVPVFQQKWESDASYERLTRYLLEEHRWLRPAFGSHNLRSLSHALAWAKELHVPDDLFEIQMLYGMAEEQAQVFHDLGHRVRIYTPFGQLIPGMAYLVRRLLENTSNDSFLRHSYDERVRLEDLLMSPSEAALHAPPPVTPPEPPFVNEPHSDFSQPEVRKAMEAALDQVADQLGEEYSLVIGGKAIQNRQWITSRNPSRKAQIVGKVALGTVDDAIAAIDSARRAFPEWSRVEVHYRAEYLELMAREMRSRRYELAAWQVYECGKPWAEADAEVAEAIDFCLYYSQQVQRLENPSAFDLPGEENSYFYRPRGVAVVIAPWNFPLAILTGMTAAAMVTGNTVVMKPAEQSSVIAAKLMEIIQTAGVPDGVVNLVPGVGEDVGPQLVGSPDVDLIAFTGSRAVGLAINSAAADAHAAQRGVKHVIAEMGGKNAIIVDSDADLDEAVVGVVQSAFGYSGQKCSACSRAIVLESAYDEFLKRLIDATAALKVGPAEDPGNDLGPVIDEEACQRIRDVIEAAKVDEASGRLVFEGPISDSESDGYFVAPHIFADVPPDAKIAQEEIFGPVLVVIRAKDMSEALAIANGTDYALTGGVYSRSPANLKRVRREFQVGNLYLNRPITGALVGRQPFGGFKLSGIGTKAGGPDYLQQFVFPVNITENTLRRGFAPSKQK
ncbi:L-glutamate gamma-semialdehyde dehydrogenase [Planctellipticum variicoloris]|uniref:L-glutamate gamma-semialdehyde dehydrogenase n=1 Tax=Planctellipticum variicoloris TaxID=3064265 RepID=UPI00301399CB|nr:L-glutamate gamma-semialdehyde dehydrogenase [Planctomycetaceae bacterium SH412]